MKQIHAHEVIEMMAAADSAYTRETLIRALNEKFGPDARFCTCSTENLDAGQMVDFLDAHDKLTRRDAGFRLAEDTGCQH